MRLARLVIIAGAVLYSAWIIAPLLGSDLSPLHSYVSEIAAQGEPYALLFRSTDLLAGTSFVVGAVLCGRLGAPLSLYARLSLFGVVIMGASTICDALMPLSCTPTADPACLAREQAGLVPFAHVAHGFTSGLAGTGAVVAVVSWIVWRLREKPDTAHPSTVAAAAVASGVFVIATIWTLAAMAMPGHLYLGLAQRLQIVSITMWLVLLAASQLRPRAARR